MHEIELKFQVPPERRAAVDAAVGGREMEARARLQAAYFDTADRALAQAGLALRIRREGRRWVQTLKGEGEDRLTRAEHEVVLPADTRADAVPDPALHAGTPVGERLRELLDAPLVCVFRTDVRRRSRRVRVREGVIELAFDEGAIVAGERRLPLCELEIELVSGSPRAVIATARRWVLRHQLWLDLRSKAERGHLLASGQTMAPVAKAGDVDLADAMAPAQGRRAVLLSCLQQIGANGSQVASGTYGDEHVHQLRVGLRRLRTALRLFRDTVPPDDVALQAAVLFRRLGAARDRAAVAAPLERDLTLALGAAGLAFAAPRLPAVGAEAEPGALMRLGPAQSLLLDLFEQTLEPASVTLPDDGSLHELLAHQVNRWHRRVHADAKRFDELDETARHTLRKRAKSLRYGIEFGAGLFKRREVERYLKLLRGLQDRLGALVDVSVALQAYRSRSEGDPHVLFALGWLAARQRELLGDCAPTMKKFMQAKRFWR
ncbi:MAG TPA: CYTH and CHAD domain-containing protein [Albitalea sp.]|uniref:CYTH and CHAD domain-containing protein n=1 Tax=Piscinibacter sp. TaxID=1903157 RepID=UPI002ED555FC